MRERIPIMKKVRMLVLFNPLVEWVDTTRFFRHILHEKTDHSKSKEVCHEILDIYSTGADDSFTTVQSTLKGADQSVRGFLPD
jgi:hypothetical protein